MHIEILVEDSSGEKLLQSLIPRFLGEHEHRHTWRIHPYKGVGRMPEALGRGSDPAKRILLDQLPRLLRGYGRTPGIDAVIVVLDSDARNCQEFLLELKQLASSCDSHPETLFRLAIEEIEAWYLGDRKALMSAYPRAKTSVLDRYVQDSVCGTWELLADAICPGGSSVIRKAGWPTPGHVKHEWAEKIGPLLDIDCNRSPSFGKLKNGLMRMVSERS